MIFTTCFRVDARRTEEQNIHVAFAGFINAQFCNLRKGEDMEQGCCSCEAKTTKRGTGHGCLNLGGAIAMKESCSEESIPRATLEGR